MFATVVEDELLAQDEYFMQQALEEAKKCLAVNEVPVGAVIVHDSKIIARAHNLMITNHSATSHAEILAIKAAGEVLQNYRLIDTTLYVTLEPCVMCVGAIIHARIKRVVFGACDFKTGAVGSAFDLLMNDKHNHHPMVTKGVLANECSTLLSSFFARRRLEIKQAQKAKRMFLEANK